MADEKNKPTKEELDEKVKEALEAQPDDNSSELPPEEESDERVSDKQEQPEEEQEDAQKELEEKKKKLSASARENQRIYAKNRVINQALSEAEEIPEPTDEQLQEEFPDWDEMTEMDKTLAKEVVISRQWRQVIANAKEQATKIEKWNEQVDTFVQDPKTFIEHPELEGLADDFRDYATQEANNSVPMNILISAYLHERGAVDSDKSGTMFQKGTGGPNEKPVPTKDTISLEEARRLRENDYAKYKEYLTAGKIERDF